VFLPHKKRIYIAVDSLAHDSLRVACAQAIRIFQKTKFKSIKIGSYLDKDDSLNNISAAIEGFILGDYNFDKYKTKKNKNFVGKIIISSEEYNNKKIGIEQAEKTMKQGQIIAEAVNLSREIVNQTPDDMTPAKLGEAAKELAKENNLQCKVYGEQFLKKNNMNAFYAVSKGSAHEPKLIHLIYKHKKPVKRIVLVGKGLTYDSGGLNLKLTNSMITMKSDKSGASAVLGIIKAAQELNLPLEIHGIIGATENMIGGKAYKPDDVLIAKNKKTIEVRNTDAEGRLILADCLCYGQEFKPDYILDFATLTGACKVALGEYTIGVMGLNDKLKKEIIQAANNSGELAAELPFNKYLSKLLKSEVADISNISSSKFGGAITAALFLSEFIEKKNKDKWIHLDIAGPAYIEKEWGYNPHGASGAGVRLALKWMENLDK
ncbi:leucyl aminopeptidase, partial [Candidatus Parcubacteria bacterium]|nr:leucyl aminopeptidase [Candidatus Parcubacteria bacterium]